MKHLFTGLFMLALMPLAFAFWVSYQLSRHPDIWETSLNFEQETA